MHHVLKYHQMYQTEGILDITHHSILESKHAKMLDYLTSMIVRFTAFPPLKTFLLVVEHDLSGKYKSEPQ